MKKKATALVVAASVAMSALVNPVGLTAQEITAADLYEPSITPIGALEAGPTEELSFFLSDEGPEFLDMEILEFDSPYPVTYRVETLNGFREYINITLEKKKIYPAAFNVPVKVRVNYTDGSSEIVTGDFPIHPLASLVADSPAAPKSSTQQTTAPVTKTVTKTVTPAPVAAPTTKVITTTVTPAPVAKRWAAWREADRAVARATSDGPAGTGTGSPSGHADPFGDVGSGAEVKSAGGVDST